MFRLPEFDLHRKVFYKVTVDEKNKPCDSPHDCIIGTDIMEAIGIDVLFSEREIKWNDLEIEMREEGKPRKHATCLPSSRV